MGLSLGHKQPGLRVKGYGANQNTASFSGISKPNGVVKRKTPVAKGTTTNRTGTTLRRNDKRGIGVPARGTEQTVGIKARVRKPGRSARVANSTGHQVSMNHYAQHPSTGPTSGLKGVSANGLKGTASRSSISRGSTSKGSLNTHTPNGQASTTIGLRGAKANGLKSKPSVLAKTPTLGSSRGVVKTRSANLDKHSTGTVGKVKAGKKGIPFMGNRREKNSSLPVKAHLNAAIPAAVRRAAARAPAPGNPGAGKKLQQPYTAKMILQNSGYKQQTAGGSKFAGVK